MPTELKPIKGATNHVPMKSTPLLNWYCSIIALQLFDPCAFGTGVGYKNGLVMSIFTASDPLWAMGYADQLIFFRIKIKQNHGDNLLAFLMDRTGCEWSLGATWTCSLWFKTVPSMSRWN